jgi:hypothetical protein
VNATLVGPAHSDTSRTLQPAATRIAEAVPETVEGEATWACGLSRWLPDVASQSRSRQWPAHRRGEDLGLGIERHELVQMRLEALDDGAWDWTACDGNCYSDDPHAYPQGRNRVARPSAAPSGGSTAPGRE